MGLFERKHPITYSTWSKTSWPGVDAYPNLVAIAESPPWPGI